MENVAFIDGSFNEKTRTYGGGGILFDQYGKPHKFSRSENRKSMARMRNVAGEILAVKTALKLAVRLGMTALTIFHDYDGLAKWVSGEWNTNRYETNEYVKFVKRYIENGLKVAFRHVKAHSGDKLNDLADQIAKKAVGL